MNGYTNVLDGKKALVIGGGGGGIGREITRAFAAAGAGLAIADIDAGRAREAAAEVADRVKAVGLTVDVRSREGVANLVSSAAEQLGGLDVLVTVVGGQAAFVPAVPLHEAADEDWDTMFELNLRYVARAVQAALRIFRTNGGGTIVSIGSITGYLGSPLQGAYGAAKAGLASIARTVAAEYVPQGIRMYVVACGAIATPVVAALADPDDDYTMIPLGRPGRTAEVADAVVFLASPLSSYITGQSLILDGGLAARGPFS